MDLSLYDDSYRRFCELLPSGRARVLDAACGPGNVSRYLIAQRPDLDLLGIDLAPRMVEFARQAVPSARYVVHDCRRLADLRMHFDGIICAFGLPYLSAQEATDFFQAASQALYPGGVFYLSTMLGKSEDSGFVSYDAGHRVYVNYHDEEHLKRSLHACGFSPVWQTHIPSPSQATKHSTDLVIVAHT